MFKEINRREFIIISLAAGAMAMVPRWVHAQAAKPYPIGVLLPSTGSGANYSERPIKGLPLIAAEINKEDGLLGKHPIELYFRDTQKVCIESLKQVSPERLDYFSIRPMSSRN